MCFNVAIDYTRSGTTCNPITNPEPPSQDYDFTGALPNGAFQCAPFPGNLMTIQRDVGAGGWRFFWQYPDWYVFNVLFTWDAGAGVFRVDYTTTPGVGTCQLRVQVAWTPVVWCVDARLRKKLDELVPPEMDLLRWEFDHAPLWGCNVWDGTQPSQADFANHARGNFHPLNSQVAARRPGQSLRYWWTGP